MLMYLRRGALPAVAISPVYTFGAPAIFCEGAGACSGEGGTCSVPEAGSIPVRPPSPLLKARDPPIVPAPAGGHAGDAPPRAQGPESY